MCDNDQECNPVVPGTVTPEPLPNPGSGGGGTTDFNQLQNRPKYGGVEMSGSTNIPNIEGLIPTTASSDNQLADKAFVNSSVATNTAYFVGTFNTIEELEAVENPSNNDYGFVITTDSAGNTVYNRYKFNSDTNTWVFEYALNNSSFTAAQWAAIQSGITSGGVDKLEALALIESVGEGLNLDANGELSFDESLIGTARELTADDYNYPTNNPDRVALWLLEPGVYRKGANIITQNSRIRTIGSVGDTFIVSIGEHFANILQLGTNETTISYTTQISNGNEVSVRNLYTLVRDSLTSTSAADALSANQGKVLNDKIGGDLSSLTTTDKTSLINAINELAGQSGGSYTAGDGIDITNSVISATNTGKIKTLSQDDYNWNYSTQSTTNPNCIAFWLLDDGIYRTESNVSGDYEVMVAAHMSYATVYGEMVFVVSHRMTDDTEYGEAKIVTITGVSWHQIIQWQYNYNQVEENAWASGGETSFATSDEIEGIISQYIMVRNNTPTEYDYAQPGCLWVYSNYEATPPEGAVYLCLSNNPVTWEQISGGGDGFATLDLSTGDKNIWLLDYGVYKVLNVNSGGQVRYLYYKTGNGVAVLNSSECYLYVYKNVGSKYFFIIYTDQNNKIRIGGGNASSSTGTFTNLIVEPVNALDSTSTARPLSANQGKVLNDKIGDLTNLTTTDKTDLVAAINELNANLGTVNTALQTLLN